MKPVVLAVAEGVRGYLHLPDEGVAPSGVGVLLLGPLGWDDQGSYRPRRVWADVLAGQGHAALRIDLPGTGNSGGGPRDCDRLAAWTATVREAVRWLRDEIGARRVAVIGLGAGGMIALHAGVSVEDLVLWGVPARGRTVVRELKAFGRLEAPQTGEDLALVPDGELRAGGHVMTAQTAEALAVLEPGAPGGSRAQRALLLGRDGHGPDAALREALEVAGVAVQVDPGNGWGATVAAPQEAAPPEPVFELVGAFLAAQAPKSGYVEPEHGAVELRIGDLRETVVSVDVDGTELVGILTEPADGPRADGVAVLLNAGAIRHIGPNRMWVEAARRWAAQGVPSLRLDVEGVGDAGGGTSPYADDADLYIPGLTRQVLVALDALQARGLPPRFLLAGVCSGAYWSLHAALADERVRTAVLLNPRLFFWDPHAEPRYELHRLLSVLSRDGLARLWRADRRLRRLLALLRWLVAAPLRLRARPSRPDGADPLDQALQRLQERGQRLVIAFSQGDEPLRDELDRERRWTELDTRGVQRHRLPLISHTLKGLEAQAAAHAVLDASVRETFDLPARTGLCVGPSHSVHA